MEISCQKIFTTKMKFILRLFLALLLIVGIGAVVITSRKLIKDRISQGKGSNRQIPAKDSAIVERRKKSSVGKITLQPWDEIRLPKSVIPDSYHLHLDVDMKNEKYSGNVTIKVNITDTTRYILFHQTNIIIDDVVVEDEYGRKLNIQNKMNKPQMEYLVLIMTSNLTAGTQCTIICHFNAPLRSDLNGFFLVKRGQSKMAYTFLSPISTRKFFPCFDEPSFKAKFRISVTHGVEYNAISNMAVDSKTYINNRTLTSFKESLPMSTYTLGLLLADSSYKSKSYKSKNVSVTSGKQYEIKLWAFEDDIEKQSEYMDELLELLKYNEETFFQIPFPLDKLDIAVIPDYSPGAMESWGLMFFRNLRSYKLRAHEVVHQWFGNLATMEFWNEAWIKEGFAQYIATILDDKMGTRKNLIESFFKDMSRALPMDSYASSHPVVPKIKTPTNIRNVYDHLVYFKGEPVVHILAKYVGEEYFRQGMKMFLQLYEYKNAGQDDLFRIMSKISGKDVKGFMDPWLLQMGYPLVTVRRINSTHIEAEQERFSMDAPNTAIEPSRFNYTWQIIITYRKLKNKSSPVEKKIMRGKKEIIEIPDDTILNPDHMQYYRIRYHDTRTLKSQLISRRNDFTNQDVLGIISDQISCFQARKASLQQTLDFFSFIKNVGQYHEWVEAINLWVKVHHLLANDTPLQKSWYNRIAKPYIKQGLEKFKNDETMYLTACRFNIRWAIKEAQIRKNAPNINMYVCCALRNDASTGQTLWYKYHEKYLKYLKEGKISLDETATHLKYLACTMNNTQIQRLLEYTMNPKYTPISDATYVFKKMIQSDLVRDIAWSFIQRRWSELFSRYGHDIYLLKEVISPVVPLFRTEAKLTEVEKFYKSKKEKDKLGTGKQAFDQAISEINMNIALTKFLKMEMKQKYSNLSVQ